MMGKQLNTLLKVVTLILIFCVTLFAQENPSDANSEETQTQEPHFIAVGDVASKVSQTLVEIEGISKQTAPQNEIIEIDEALEGYIESIQALFNDPINSYLDRLSLPQLLKKEESWKLYLKQLEKWNTLLNSRIDIFEQEKKRVKQAKILWKSSYKNAMSVEAPKAILEQITKLIVTLEKLEVEIKKRYDTLLTDTTTLGSNILEINALLKRNKKAQKVVSNKLFTQNGLSFFTLYAQESFAPMEYFEAVFASIQAKMKSFGIYYLDNQDKLSLFAIYSSFILFIVLLFFYLYKKHRLFVKEESYSDKNYAFIQYPFSSFFIFGLLLNLFMFSDIPQSAKQFQLLFVLIPMVRLLSKLIEKDLRRYLYIFVSLFVVGIIERNGTYYGLDARVISITLDIGLVIFIFFLVKHHLLETMTHRFIQRFIYKFLLLFMFLLVVAIGADIYGATQLSTRLSSTVLIAMLSALFFYLVTVMLTGVLIVTLRRRMAHSFLPLTTFKQNVEKSITILIKLFMLIWWLFVVSKAMQIQHFIIDAKNDFMALSWEIGSVVISITSIFDFVITILGTWFTVKVVNILLKVELFSRVKFARGVPTAITTVTNYIIVISGFFIAFSSLGITREQFTLLFGALGVGIGFGLRNIIANFVSGLIMVFERPIQIGDTIEINNTMGTVHAIGTRSSTIETFDGSEVIIPNADFISKEITNWTLSDNHRRKTLRFKVALDSDIQQVLEIMQRVVTAHPNVLKEPQPMATFLGFEEYYLEFKLYYWLCENLIMAQSDIAIDIYEILQKEGIAMPTPKQKFVNLG